MNLVLELQSLAERFLYLLLVLPIHEEALLLAFNLADVPACSLQDDRCSAQQRLMGRVPEALEVRGRSMDICCLVHDSQPIMRHEFAEADHALVWVVHGMYGVCRSRSISITNDGNDEVTRLVRYQQLDPLLRCPSARIDHQRTMGVAARQEVPCLAYLLVRVPLLGMKGAILVALHHHSVTADAVQVSQLRLVFFRPCVHLACQRCSESVSPAVEVPPNQPLNPLIVRSHNLVAVCSEDDERSYPQDLCHQQTKGNARSIAPGDDHKVALLQQLPD
mmetsp:Transcript_27008/g.88317  ORF Transcript_27008/g.88317 Transcript_27008/m.88317 type:complete len:277 (-) Transcript_27008:280-1110(-)